MKVVVIIPTYNESENIDRLVPALAEEFNKIPSHDFTVLFVDGNSPDGTADRLRKMSGTYPFIQVIVETQKSGLGAAYMLGFDYAVKNLTADVIIEMDADLQHNPTDIAKLVAGIDEGFDYVIGSRYVNGISIPKEWSLYRKFMSVGGNIFTRIVLGLFSITDFTTGFKASRVKDFVDKIDLSQISSKGFAYKMDLLYKMHKLGAKIKEVPITFGLRDRGTSKMERDNALDSLKVVLMLRFKESQSFFKFLAVGVCGLFADSSLFNILRLTFLTSASASAASGFVAMLVTYTLNNFWSFGDRKKATVADNVKSFAVFAAFSYVPILFRSWLVKFATAQIADTVLVANAAFLVGVLIGLVWNFTVYSKFIWRKAKA